MKIAAVVVLTMTALAMLELILASVAVIFAERDELDFEDKAFVFGFLAGGAGFISFLCASALILLF